MPRKCPGSSALPGDQLPPVRFCSKIEARVSHQILDLSVFRYNPLFLLASFYIFESVLLF